MSRMLELEHSEMVGVLCKPGEVIKAELSEMGAHWWHMSSCLCGESGELFDAIKKHVIYGKEIDLENVVEELGDIEFYLEGLRQGMGITREETLSGNIKKLAKRYKDFKYSNQAAQDRADKA